MAAWAGGWRRLGQLVLFLAVAEVGLRIGAAGTLRASDVHPSATAWRVDKTGLPAVDRLAVPAPLLIGRGAARGDAPRVLIVGDSFAAGEGVHPGEDAASRLAAATGWEVRDHGFSGTSFQEQAALYEDHGRLLAADAVVLWFVLNDLPSASAAADLREAGLDGPFADGIVDRTLDAGPPTGLALVDVPWALSRRARVGVIVERAYQRGYDPAFSSEDLDRMEAKLRGLVADQTARGGRFLFVVHPILHAMGASHPFLAAYGELARRARAAGAEVLDLYPAYEGRPAHTWWASVTDHHPNGDGHAAVASALEQALRPGGLPRSAAPTCSTMEGAIGAARRARCEAPNDALAALALAQARWTVDGHEDAGFFDVRRLVAVLLHEAVGLARGTPAQAEVEAAAELLAQEVRAAR